MLGFQRLILDFQQSAVGSQRSAFSSQQSAIGFRRLALSSRRSVLGSRRSAFSSWQLASIVADRRLCQIISIWILRYLMMWLLVSCHMIVQRYLDLLDTNNLLQSSGDHLICHVIGFDYVIFLTGSFQKAVLVP